jgi:Sulfotransferase domain
LTPGCHDDERRKHDYLQVFVLPSIDWRELAALRPEAKVILTERPEEQWRESFCSTIKFGMGARSQRSVHSQSFATRAAP